jgi:hypothetical protein
MATSKSAASKPRKKANRSSNGSAPKAKSASGRSTKAASRSKPTAKAARSRSGATKPRSRTAKSSSSSNGSGSSAAASRLDGAVGTVKHVASKAKGPAVAVGAATAGVAGGLLLKSRLSRPKVLGIPVPRSLGKPNLDVKSIAKTVGEASQSFAKTSKSVSKDIERAGDQAERIGKILS